ncbi:hypothetical protein [Psychroflexus tropicus]|uniref:hypothetical protein n=1 Tax=Psychroflexus tropicus TaxID=197345 RepID=UPI000367A45B|nr:hypothetical protein [Psychroflexus tropicus]
MKKLILGYVLFAIVLFSILIFFDIKEKNEFWSDQIQITRSIEINEKVLNTRYEKGLLSFNGKYYIVEAHLKQAEIQLIDITDLKHPYRLKKEAENDKIKIVLDDQTLTLELLDLIED